MCAKLLVISERWWPEGSGGELATYLILDLLRDYFEITVVTGSKNPAKIPGVKFIFEPLLSARYKQFLWINLTRLSMSEYFRKLVNYADVVYVPKFAFPIIPIAKKMRKKVIVHLHGYNPVSYTATILAPFEEHRRRIIRDDFMLECMKGFKYCAGVALSWWLPKLVRKWISEADTVICVSKRQAYIVSELARELREKIRVIYNPPPRVPSTEKRLAEKPTFLYVGGGSYMKGYHIIVKALRMLGEKGWVKAKFTFTNTYTKQQVEELMTLKKKYKIDIEILGRVSYEEVLKAHSESWALLFPSIWEEPLPYAAVESMLLGTTPVSSRVGGVPEIAGGSPAEIFVFSPRNVEEMLLRIKNIALMDMKDLEELSYKLRDFARQKFNKKAIKKRILEIF